MIKKYMQQSVQKENVNMINYKNRTTMGEIADAMYRGELCITCGVYLEPGEIVYLEGTDKKVNMPKNGNDFGVPVECKDCHDNL